jgi:cystathionine beta-synthase
MQDQGFTDHLPKGDLQDLVSRKYEEGAVITVGPEDPLLTAFQRMRLADISQVPVIENGRCVGVLDESDLLLAVHDDQARFRTSVRTAMTSRLETIAHDESLERLYDILNRGLVALVLDGNHFLGLITDYPRPQCGPKCFKSQVGYSERGVATGRL